MTTGIAYSVDDNFSGVVPIDNVVRASRPSRSRGRFTPKACRAKAISEVMFILTFVVTIDFLFLRCPAAISAEPEYVDFSQFATDLSNHQLPAYSFIVPDAEHDAHDCPGGGTNCDIGVRVAAADTWLSANIRNCCRTTIPAEWNPGCDHRRICQ